ncbi:hypothetical protein [Streptomyces sp. NPDC000888]
MAVRRAPAHDAAATVFSDRFPAAEGSAPAAGPTAVPRARAVSPNAAPPGTRQGGKIAQRIVPHTLRPDALRGDLVELGMCFVLISSARNLASCFVV